MIYRIYVGNVLFWVDVILDEKLFNFLCKYFRIFCFVFDDYVYDGISGDFWFGFVGDGGGDRFSVLVLV